MFSNMAAEQHSTNNTCINKRRRFAANTFPIPEGFDNSGSTTPLILELCDQAPSQQEIEAQLLQVGMRIRKSVADGYQNTPGRRAFTPRPFMNFNRLSAETQAAISNPSANADAQNRAGVSSIGTPLHATTFCGINLAMMSHISTAPAIGEQKLWSYSTAHKRRQQFEEEESDSDDSQEFMPRTPQLECADMGMGIPQGYFQIDTEFGSSNEAATVQQLQVPRQNTHNRRMAQPRSRLRAVPQEPVAPVVNPFAQFAQMTPARSGFGHQRMRSCGMEAMDFGEATFLQARQDVDMDCS